MRGVRGRSGGGQSWATFVKNHAERMWACDFIQTHDLLFRQVYAFFIVHLVLCQLSILAHPCGTVGPMPAGRSWACRVRSGSVGPAPNLGLPHAPRGSAEWIYRTGALVRCGRPSEPARPPQGWLATPRSGTGWQFQRRSLI